jgi:NAD+ synthase (glutamine-hydrolysing)
MGLTVALGQVAARVGAIEANAAAILDAWRAAADAGAHLVVLPELALTGYPPEDLLLKAEFVSACERALAGLAASGPAGTAAVVGHVARVGQRSEGRGARTGIGEVAAATPRLANAASLLSDGSIRATYAKVRLPNYGVFDEARYFSPGSDACVVEVAGTPVGITVCEDLWTDDGPVAAAVTAGARVIVNVNASPYHRGKRVEREHWVTRHAKQHGVPVVYTNLVGGHDEVVFDGDSMVADATGRIVARGAQFTADLVVVDVADDGSAVPRGPTPRPLDPLEEVWQALVTATRDYCAANRFDDAIVGVSGGIDSAVVAAIAVDALGAAHVTGVAMPSPYSSAHSIADARALTSALRCRHLELPIAGPLAATSTVLGDEVATGFGGARTPGVAYENLQSRLRGVLLMTLSNEHGAIVLTTGNKSEYAVGYATLYGDMAGGFAPLKDVPKTLVYELARWRNRSAAVIPVSTIDKPPSAELRPGQVDQDSLPPYDVLDDLIAGYVEEDASIDTLVARGHDRALVVRVVAMIDRAEHKRRQAAPGPKVTRRAFGRDRRLPISNAWDPRTPG